ncbi:MULTISPECIES: baseplate J/gp47 family protein [unclassified Chelatococcus]|uniref:baseplate assembly protein n=1 Tax=unclassified Chelatococcus TaxID=2638111 RepID=UPI001BCB26E1|nr:MULTISPECIES: baseplate J/gp47 family protein [unclassified Chelatococcus]MBS7737784.1 baseplate J/gp47 family protein [Chelatococcus sp. HY11]MCO5079240.1 baseplate J/gp47 family protein [Chelatococcus sp.]CAH1665863.1 Phage-related baseplate assembly protein [Hyphomicrobiales bacterium]CAH1681056.1 Phage-related baseplate assembly protein [Hyphomicrobiales bacterium]
MSRFSASTLDLSRIDKSTLFDPLSFETFRQERIDDLKARLEAAGMEWDTFSLEDDSNIPLQETGALREMFVSQQIRDVAYNLTLAFAKGVWLDRLGDQHGTARMPLVAEPRDFATNPEDWESDDRYRGRIQLAPEGFASSGTPGGYLYHAMAASIDVRDAAVVVRNKGKHDPIVEMTVLSRLANGEPSAALTRAVRSRLMRDDIKLLTDALRVRPARPVSYAVKATLLIPPGPDPAVIKANAVASVQAMGDRYRRLGGGVPHSAIVASLHVAGVDSAVQVMPTQSVETLRFQYGLLTGVDIAVEVMSG